MKLFKLSKTILHDKGPMVYRMDEPRVVGLTSACGWCHNLQVVEDCKII